MPREYRFSRPFTREEIRAYFDKHPLTCLITLRPAYLDTNTGKTVYYPNRADRIFKQKKRGGRLQLMAANKLKKQPRKIIHHTR